MADKQVLRICLIYVGKAADRSCRIPCLPPHKEKQDCMKPASVLFFSSHWWHWTLEHQNIGSEEVPGLCETSWCITLSNKDDFKQNVWHLREEASLLSLPIQVLIASRNILVDRIMFGQMFQHPMAQSRCHIKLAITIQVNTVVWKGEHSSPFHTFKKSWYYHIFSR